MGKAYYQQSDAKMRLDGTVCLYDGKPVHVQVMDTKDMVRICPIDKVYTLHPAQWEQVKYTDDKFSYKSPPLGYVNSNGKATYLTRIPDRKQRQGLTLDIITTRPKMLPGYSFEQSFYTQGYIDCVLNKYPTLDEALALLEKGKAEAVAISRSTALSFLGRNVVGLNYKGRQVGIRNGHRWQLFDQPQRPFLTKIMTKEGIYTS
jgi:hypothetical protein